MSLNVLVNWRRSSTYAIPVPPTDVSGLAVWWHADEQTNTATGGVVGAWSARKGTAAANQTTAAFQPTRQAVAGRPTVRFDGSNDRLMLNGDALTALQNCAGATVFARVQANSTTPGVIVAFGGGAVIGNHRFLLRIVTPGNWNAAGRRLDGDSLQSTGNSTAVNTSAVTVLGAVFDYANTDAFLYVNGVLSDTNASFQTSGSTSNTTSLAAAFGASASEDTFASCDLYEVLVYNRALTATERQTVEAYLMAGGLLADDVTALTRPGLGALSFEYGRDQSTALAPTVTGRGSLVLSNRDKRFSPRNTASPLYGYLKPARPVKITRTVLANTSGTYDDLYSDTYEATGEETYTLFVGHTDDSPINPDPNEKTLTLSLIDQLADFRRHDISTAVYRGIRTGDAIGYVLDAAGWTGGRDLDSGATYIPWWWEDNTDAYNALEKLIRSEGPPAMLTVGTGGEIVFRDRHHRLTRAGSLTSQQTWIATGTGLVMGRPFTYEESWSNLVNSGVAAVDIRAAGILQSVWNSDDIITLSAGQQKMITVSGTDPFYSAVAPVAGTDFTAELGTVTAALLNTSGGSTSIVLTASLGGNARISGLQLRAHPIPVGRTEQVSISNPDSKTEYGTRTYPGDLPWCNPYDAEAVLSTAVAIRAEPVPILTVRFLIGTDTAKTQLLGLDLGDRVTVVEPETSTNADFYIESIGHELTGEHDHAIIFGLEAAPAAAGTLLRFDTAGAGFNDGVFGSGLDEAGNIFRFDSTSGHRFNEGVFAT